MPAVMSERSRVPEHHVLSKQKVVQPLQHAVHQDFHCEGDDGRISIEHGRHRYRFYFELRVNSALFWSAF